MFKMNKVKYIGFYDAAKNGHERVSTLSGENKMNFISSTLYKAGFDVDIISPSWSIDNAKDKTNLKSKNVLIEEGRSLILFPTFRSRGRVLKLFKVLFSLSYLLFWLLKHVEKGEKVLVYHSPLLSYPLLIAKSIKKFEIVLEVEEIYSEVWRSKKIYSKMEWRIINASSKYICVSDHLSKRLGTDKSIVVYGSYNMPINKNGISKRGGVNLVYAGSLDTVKGGVFNSIESMWSLDKNYTLHICGYGTESQIEIISNKINELNNALERESCFFYGKLLGQDLSDLLFSCDIALNPQHQGEYMTTAFPSKILTYLTHNLHVMSTNIESIKNSIFSDLIYFSVDDSAIEIAKAISSIDIETASDNTILMLKLETELIQTFKDYFNNNNILNENFTSN